MTQQRDTRILDVRWLSPESSLPHSHVTFRSEYRSDLGAVLDLKTIVEALLVILSIVLLTKACLWIFRGICSNKPTPAFAASMIISRSHYLPYSVDTLFDASCLSIHWRMCFVPPQERSHQVSARVDKSFAIAPSGIPLRRGPLAQYIGSNQPTTSCSTCFQNKAQWGWPAAQGFPIHDRIYDVRSRSAAVWSMVRLINLAMLTDPLVLIRLYGFGQRLFLYRITDEDCSSGEPETLVLLPCGPSALAEEMEPSDRCRYELLDQVDPASVPWTLLLQCG